MSESTPFFKKPSVGKPYPSPLSLSWRVIHSFMYCLGGISFVIASGQYYPSISNFSLGGWLFSIGSLGFMIADSMEWWTNNRVGCFLYQQYKVSYEEVNRGSFSDESTVVGILQRAEIGANFFLSLIGSTLYLVGSIMFIPRLNDTLNGTWIFIYASIIIFFSQSWKVIRAGSINIENAYDKSFRFTNYLSDLPALQVDSFAGLGGLSYLIGSVYLLPQYNVSDLITIRSTNYFVCGGLFYAFSGACILYRYFLTENYPH